MAHSKCTCMVKVSHTHLCAPSVFDAVFSITVQRICMIFGVGIAPNSGCTSLLLGHCCSFSFGAEKVLVPRFVRPFKCTVEKQLQTLITPHSKVLRNCN